MKTSRSFFKLIIFISLCHAYASFARTALLPPRWGNDSATTTTPTHDIPAGQVASPVPVTNTISDTSVLEDLLETTATSTAKDEVFGGDIIDESTELVGWDSEELGDPVTKPGIPTGTLVEGDDASITTTQDADIETSEDQDSKTSTSPPSTSAPDLRTTFKPHRVFTPTARLINIDDDEHPVCEGFRTARLRIKCYDYVTSTYDPAVGVIAINMANETTIIKPTANDQVIIEEPVVTLPPEPITTYDPWEGIPEDVTKYLDPAEVESKCASLASIETAIEFKETRCDEIYSSINSEIESRERASASACPSSCKPLNLNETLLYYTYTYNYPDCTTKHMCTKVRAPKPQEGRFYVGTSFINYKIPATKWIARNAGASENKNGGIGLGMPVDTGPRPGQGAGDNRPIQTSAPEGRQSSTLPLIDPGNPQPPQRQPNTNPDPQPPVPEPRVQTHGGATGIIGGIWTANNPQTTNGGSGTPKNVGGDGRDGGGREWNPGDSGNKGGSDAGTDEGQEDGGGGDNRQGGNEGSNKGSDRNSNSNKNPNNLQQGGRAPTIDNPSPGDPNFINPSKGPPPPNNDWTILPPTRTTPGRPDIPNPIPPPAVQSIVNDLFGNGRTNPPSSDEIRETLSRLPPDTRRNLGDWIDQQVRGVTSGGTQNGAENGVGGHDEENAGDEAQRLNEVPPEVRKEISDSIWKTIVARQRPANNSPGPPVPPLSLSPETLSKIDLLPPSIREPLKTWISKNSPLGTLPPEILTILTKLDPSLLTDPEFLAIGLDTLLNDDTYNKRLREEVERDPTLSSILRSTQAATERPATSTVSRSGMRTSEVTITDPQKSTTTKRTGTTRSSTEEEEEKEEEETAKVIATTTKKSGGTRSSQIAYRLPVFETPWRIAMGFLVILQLLG